MLTHRKCLQFIHSVILFIAFALQANDELVEVNGDRYILDLRYNTSDNFLKTNVYKSFGLNKCYVAQALAYRLMELSKKLEEKKLKLIFFDCYRPLEVQRAMWAIMPDPRYVANPLKGSNHNRGVAIDVGLAFEDGLPLEFPTPFDDFTPRASHLFVCEKEKNKGCINRDLLKDLMVSVGFKSLNSEWWHYELPKAKEFPLIERSHAVSK